MCVCLRFFLFLHTICSPIIQHNDYYIVIQSKSHGKYIIRHADTSEYCCILAQSQQIPYLSSFFIPFHYDYMQENSEKTAKMVMCLTLDSQKTKSVHLHVVIIVFFHVFRSYLVKKSACDMYI